VVLIVGLRLFSKTVKIAKEGCMSFIKILIRISACIAIVCTYRAIKKGVFPSIFKASDTGGTESPDLHFVTRREFASHAKSTHDLVLSHLQSSQLIRNHANSSLWRAGITVEELEKCIAWIPYNSSILVSSTDGFSPKRLRNLKGLQTRRGIFFISEAPDNLGSTERAEARAL
jgi:hypothetical protein